VLVTKTIQALNSRYDLNRKMAKEPGVADILQQMAGRLANSYRKLPDISNKKILDIACGSNTSKLPGSLYINTPFGEMSFGRASRGYTALFEPWFCRILFELGAQAVGLDFGDLEHEAFAHYRVDLGKAGALDFLPDRSFDGIQDSRLFGSPEFTAQFPNPADRLKVAREIVRQEHRLLKPGGIMIHSDAAELME
jgi:SAM-dependent methyltransferase